MKKNTYAKPFLVVEKFTPNEFVASCNVKIHFTSGSFMEYTQRGNALYYDDDTDGRYDDGERVGASSAMSNHTVEINLQTNIDAGYIITSASTGLLTCKNQNDGHYYTSVVNNRYGAATKYAYIIMDKNNVVHYFNTGGFEVLEKLRS